MSAAGEDTLPQENDEFEDMEASGSDEDDMEGEGQNGDGEVYVPGLQPLQPGEELEMDRSAYRMYHECQTGQCSTSCPITKHKHKHARSIYA